MNERIGAGIGFAGIGLICAVLFYNLVINDYNQGPLAFFGIAFFVCIILSFIMFYNAN